MGMLERIRRRAPAGGAYGGIVTFGTQRYNAYAWEFSRIANSVYANPTGYRCVEWIGNNLCRPTFQVFNPDEEEPIKKGPFLTMLDRPHAMYSGTEMQAAWGMDGELCGKSFWAKLRGPDGNAPRGQLTGLNRIPAQRMTVVANDDDELIGFIYADRKGQRAAVLPDEVVYLRYPHPDRHFDGMPPAIMAGLGAETDNAAARFNYDLLANDGAPPGYLTVEDLTPDQFDEWKAKWDSGAVPGKTRFLAGNARYNKIGLSNQEMTYDDLRKSSRLDICTGFGLLPQLLNPSDTTFSNMGEGKTLFWQQTIIPKLEKIKDQFNRQVEDEFNGQRIGFDLSEIEELQESLNEKLDRYIRAVDRKIVTINEVRRDVLGLDPVEWGDDPYEFPSGPAYLSERTRGPDTLGSPADMGERDRARERNRGPEPAPSTRAVPAHNPHKAGDPSVEANGGASRNATALLELPETKAGQWETFNSRVERFEQRTQDKITRFFERQGRVVAARVGARGGKALANPVWFDRERWDRELAETVAECLTDVADYFGTTTLDRLAKAFDTEGAMAEWITSRSTNMAGLINGTTEAELREVIAAMEAEGSGIDEIVRATRGYFSGEESRARTRAEIVARTEIIGAANYATLEAAKQSGVATGKRWLATSDSRTEGTCAALDGIRVGLEDEFPGGHAQPPAHPQCFPAGVVVSGPKPIGSTTRRYEGDLVVLEFASGNKLPVTPNHPILTPEGWAQAGHLDKGGYVVRSTFAQGEAARVGPHDGQIPALIEQVAGAVEEPGGMSPIAVPVAPEDFHGDGVGSKVAVVRTNRLLMDHPNPPIFEPGSEEPLPEDDSLSAVLARARRRAQDQWVLGSTTGSGVSGGCVSEVLVGAASRHHEPVGVSNAASSRPAFQQAPPDRGPTDAVALSQGILGLPREVTLDEIVNVERVAFHGSVFNLETISGWYYSNGVVSHNCRCTLLIDVELPTLETT